MEKNSTPCATCGNQNTIQKEIRRLQPKADTLRRLRMLARAAYAVPAEAKLPLMILN